MKLTQMTGWLVLKLAGGVNMMFTEVWAQIHRHLIKLYFY